MPELDDLTYSGTPEFARQWALVSRRERYTPGSGSHRLWLTCGGSAGHSGLWGVDVEEGSAGEPRRWEVSVSTPTEVHQSRQERTKRQRLIAAARELPLGGTKTDLATLAHLKNDATINAILMSLVNDGILEMCKVSKNGTTFDGYRLAPNVAACAS